MPNDSGWSRDQLTIALELYCKLPFGRMHSRNPEIARYAKLIGRSPSALAMKLTNFASLDPAIRSTGRRGLTGASQRDKAIWAEMTSDWDHFAREIEQAELRLGTRIVADEANAVQDEAMANYRGETRATTIQARIGQNLFRESVLSAYEFKCCITGLDIPELLIASHIVPWRTDANNRLNPKNGLCLSSIHDRAFDTGLIAISSDLRVLVSRRVKEREPNPLLRECFNRFSGTRITLPSKFAPDPA